MNYKKHYNLLINRARCRTLTGYVERHHIIPRCLGGSDNKNNIVILTPEEHFVAHQLLCKIHPHENKLFFALNMMTVGSKNHKRNNKRYAWLRKEYGERIRINRVSRGPDKKPRVARKKETKPRNRNYIVTDQQKQKNSISLKGKIWWNNGIVQTKSKEQPSSDFIKGRIKTELASIVQRDKNILTLKHNIHGIFIGTRYQLIQLYPEITSNMVSNLLYGYQKTVKGWYL